MPRRRSVRMIRTAISPRLATSTLSKIVTWSHPEDAVGHRLHRRLADETERQAEHVARVAGLDDPVVPQPRRRVVRVTLAFVLITDRRLELLLVLDAPRLTAALD